jgi:hypothetical protein
MKKEDRQEIITEILETVHMKKRGIYLLEKMLDGIRVYPCSEIKIKKVAKLCGKLNNLGLTIAFSMNNGPHDTTWELMPDSVSNYHIMRRNETINAIIA